VHFAKVFDRPIQLMHRLGQLTRMGGGPEHAHGGRLRSFLVLLEREADPVGRKRGEEKRRKKRGEA
jgi:hypothetical protein